MENLLSPFVDLILFIFVNLSEYEQKWKNSVIINYLDNKYFLLTLNIIMFTHIGNCAIIFNPMIHNPVLYDKCGIPRPVFYSTREILNPVLY